MQHRVHPAELATLDGLITIFAGRAEDRDEAAAVVLPGRDSKKPERPFPAPSVPGGPPTKAIAARKQPKVAKTVRVQQQPRRTLK